MNIEELFFTNIRFYLRSNPANAWTFMTYFKTKLIALKYWPKMK